LSSTKRKPAGGARLGFQAIIPSPRKQRCGPSAHRHFVSQMLALVQQQMAGLAREGEITYVAAAFQPKTVVGTWKFLDEETK